MTPEAGFLASVIDLAHICGWTVAHFRAARTEHGWRTPVQADGAGWPDLVLVRPPELIVAELKSVAGRVQPHQKRWIAMLRACGVEVTVWRPSDWPAIEARLQRRTETTG
jgi:hypothetical protein